MLVYIKTKQLISKHEFFLDISLLQALNQEEEYVYDDGAENALSKGGHRLVGAARAEVKETPFLVGYNTEEMKGKHYVSCTGISKVKKMKNVLLS